MRKATRLRGNSIGVHEGPKACSIRDCCFDRIRGRIHADHRVSASIQQSFEDRKQIPAHIVGGMIRLRTDCPVRQGWPIVFLQRVTFLILAAARTRSLLLMIFAAAAAISGMMAQWEDESSSARPWWHHRGISRRNSPTVKLLTRLKRFLALKCFKDEAADVVLVRVDQRLLRNNLSQELIGELAFCGDALALRLRGDSRQLVAGLLLVGLGKEFAQIRKHESLQSRIRRHAQNPPPAAKYHQSPIR